jgi:metallophosphoesterase superfamily enzyme
VTATDCRDRAVYLPAADALVLADVHVGRDRTSNVELSLCERADLVERLAALVDRYDPAEAVVAGDLLHAFESVPQGVAETVGALRGVLARADASLVLVAGNHDTMLSSVHDGPVHDAYRLDLSGDADGDGTDPSDDGPAPAADPDPPTTAPDGDDPASTGGGGPTIAPGADSALVVHGHEPPTESADLYLVGHDHPAIEIEGRRRPCYLAGPVGPGRAVDTGAAPADASVLALPAFNRLAAGVVVNGARRGDLQSPLLYRVDELRPVVRDPDADETLTFPPLGEFRRLL